MRALAVASVLRDKGLAIEDGAIEVGGQTEIFGPDARDNQRVVVTFQ